MYCFCRGPTGSRSQGRQPPQRDMDRVAARCVVSVANAPVLPKHWRACTAVASQCCLALSAMPAECKCFLAVRSWGSNARCTEACRRHYRQTVSALLQRSMEIGEHPTALATRIAQDVISARGEGTVSLSARLLSTLSRRCSWVRRYVNRNAAGDCARHFAHVAESVSRLSASNALERS
jgi:hypothetical protein